MQQTVQYHLGSFQRLLGLDLKHVVVVVYSLSCPTLCDPIDPYSPLGSSVHGISQARILEWVAISSSRRSSEPMDQSQSSALAGRFVTTVPLGKSLKNLKHW